MPYQVNEARRHKILKARYHVRNWRAYDHALQQRGSLTVWVTPAAITAWHPPPTGSGAAPVVTPTWRSRPGTCCAWREILASELTGNGMGDLSMVGPLLEQIPGVISSVLADGAYDAEPVYRASAARQPQPPPIVIIPPRATAVPSPNTSLRDRHIQMMQEKGRRGWQKAVGYGKRALVEAAMFRYKTLIGSRLRTRTLPAQKSEARVACSLINRMTELGMPVSQRL
jgi:hypothetical protein